MRPHRLTIPGEFWDSHLYRGRLYLMHRDGAAEVIDWDKAVSEVPTDESTALAKTAAFARSDFLYATAFSPLFADLEVRRLVEQKFERLSEWDLQIDLRLREACRIGMHEISVPFPYADALIYGNRLYAVASDGVHSATVGRGLKHGVSTKAFKIWDCQGYALSASWGSLAIAAGDEGLFEHELDSYPAFLDESRGPTVASHVGFCSHAFQSVFASSSLAEGVLADYSRPDEDEDEHSARFGRRRFRATVPAHRLFGRRGDISWGSQDKLCQVSDSSVNIVRYQPWGRDEPRFHEWGVVQLAPWKGSVISGGVATFGIIIETENAMVIVPSQGRPVTLEGEVIRWRHFPRSTRYENQLHVLYDDRLEVWSFNQDFFVDQRTKVAGTEFRLRPSVREGVAG